MYSDEATGPDLWSNVMDFNDGSAYYNLGTFGADCEAYATIPTKGSFGFVELRVRCQGVGSAVTAASAYFYAFRWDASDDRYALRKCVAGTQSEIIGLTTRAFSSGDKFGIQVMGTRIGLWHYTAGTWTEFTSANDSSVSGVGYIGVNSNDGSAYLDDFGGGTVAPALRSQYLDYDYSR